MLDFGRLGKEDLFPVNDLLHSFHILICELIVLISLVEVGALTSHNLSLECLLLLLGSSTVHVSLEQASKWPSVGILLHVHLVELVRVFTTHRRLIENLIDGHNRIINLAGRAFSDDRWRHIGVHVDWERNRSLGILLSLLSSSFEQSAVKL